MSLNDPISDLITRIRNGQKAGLRTVTGHASKHTSAILDALVREGYIRSHETIEVRAGIRAVRVELKYFRNAPTIRMIRRISKPSRRVYVGHERIPRHRNGLGVTLLSTPLGVLSDREARRAHVGGEVLLDVF